MRLANWQRNALFALVGLCALAPRVAYAQGEVDATSIYLGPAGTTCLLSTSAGAPSGGSNCAVAIDRTNHVIYVKNGSVGGWSQVPLVDLPNVFTNFQTISAAAPFFYFYETDQGSDLKRWRWIANGQLFELQTANDAGSSVLATPVSFTRAGAATFLTTVNATTGFKVNGGATNTTFLKGNGTNFVEAAGSALTKTDDTNVTLTLGGSASTALVNAASITAAWAGTLAYARGGCGTWNSTTANLVVYTGASGCQVDGDLIYDGTNLEATRSAKLASGESNEMGNYVLIGNNNGSNVFDGGKGIYINELLTTLGVGERFYGAFVQVEKNTVNHSIIGGHFVGVARANGVTAEGIAGIGQVASAATGIGDVRGGYLSANTNHSSGTVAISIARSVWLENDFADNTTITDLYGAYINFKTLGGSGSSATNYYGVYVDSTPTAGAITTGYGLYLTDVTGATTDYGVYQAGANDENFFAGPIANTYTSGWTGAGYSLSYNTPFSGESFLELDRLSVRGIFNVYELLVHQIRATNGSIFVANTGKSSAVVDNGGGSYTITTETDHGFDEDDVIRAQRFTGASTWQSDLTVTSVADTTHFTATLRGGTTVPTAGMDFVRLGNTSDPDRQGSIYLTADDTNAPYINVISGVAGHTQWGTSAKTQVRMGNLNGSYGYSANTYGFAAGDAAAANVTIDATNGIRIRHSTTDKITLSPSGDATFTGTVTAAAGAIGGFNIGSDYIRDTGNSFGMKSTVTGGNDCRFWAGDTSANCATAPFHIFEDGELRAGTVTAKSTGITVDSASTIAVGQTSGYRFTACATYTDCSMGLYGAYDSGTGALMQKQFVFTTSGPGSATIDSTASTSNASAVFTLTATNVAGSGAATLSATTITIGGSVVVSDSTMTATKASGTPIVGSGVTGVNAVTADAATTGTGVPLIVDHTTSGTAAAGFTTSIKYRSESASGTLRDAAAINARWTTATDASRTSAFDIQLVDNAGALATVFSVGSTGVVTLGAALPVGSGGTGVTSLTSGRILLGGSTVTTDAKWAVSGNYTTLDGIRIGGTTGSDVTNNFFSSNDYGVGIESAKKFRIGSSAGGASSGCYFYRSGGLTCGVDADSGAGKIDAYNGFIGRAGSGGAAGNAFNIKWNTTYADLWIDTNNAGTIAFTSDQRGKGGITALTSGLDEVLRLEFDRFYFLDDPDKRLRYGVIAQQVRPVLPDLVRQTTIKSPRMPDGTLQVDYNGLIAVIGRGLQQEDAKVMALSAQLSALAARVTVLEAEVLKLKVK